MKNPPIWESASRPLFVKSIWLEAGHRHFILDREPSQRLESGAGLKSRREPMRASVSCDLPALDDELLLVGSSKAQCQQNLSATGDYRRFSSRKLFIDHFRKRYGLLREDIPSKRSSLQDINSIMTSNSHSDEKLAERVLNWLDLAGKTPLLCPIQDRPAQKKTKKDRSAQKRQERCERQESSTCSRRPDSVKHITIIFNKEGVPLRLNRPARNIDLCAVTSSAGAVRRLAGSLASARLYEDSLNVLADDGGGQRPRTTGARKPATREGSAKKTERHICSSAAMSDAKRQLHIFMPSLPKKALVSEEAACSEVT